MYDSEKELLMEVAAGSEKAFRELFNQYHQHLGRYIFTITRSRVMAEEIVQDVFMKIWVNHQRLSEVQSFKAYLFVLSRNYTLNYLRKVARDQLLKDRWQQDVVQALKAEDGLPSSYYRLLDQAIDQLPTQQRTVYLLSRHQRLKYSEIAERLNLSRETVKSYLKIATSSITSYITSNLEAIVPTIVFFIIS